MAKGSLKQNIVKNVLIIIIAIFFWPVLSASLREIQIQQLGDFLVMISILLVTVCFANFAFTYEKSKLTTTSGKLLSHLATFIFMLLILLLLESMALAVRVIYPSFFPIIFWFSVLLYTGVILYDFWDFFRSEY